MMQVTFSLSSYTGCTTQYAGSYRIGVLETKAALLRDLHIVVPIAIPSVCTINIVVSIAYTVVQASVPVPVSIARTL